MKSFFGDDMDPGGNDELKKQHCKIIPNPKCYSRRKLARNSLILRTLDKTI